MALLFRDCLGFTVFFQACLGRVYQEFQKSVTEWIDIAASSDDLAEVNLPVDEKKMKYTFSPLNELPSTLEIGSYLKKLTKF